MKTCKDCKAEKEDSDFYGIQGECKDCTKKRVSKNYRTRLDYYKKYYVARNKRPERKAIVLKSQQKQRMAHPEKYLARQKALRAIRSGLLVKQPCQVCGKGNVEAHHEDYLKPLKVIWLCKKHHIEADRQLKAKSITS